ncbi:MAG TPA: nicotinate-nucleotide--dimethylbenzimidazole phosphoribosyltransferase [Jatrophihabitans sp.]|nr:nicotinate-nucleotide--dimethylbenzimidazole phosphoribosyltransferase [Jatrophihabitans sp.]
MTSPFAEAVEQIDYPDSDAAHRLRLAIDASAVPSGALGRLGELAAWAAGVQGSCPPSGFERATLVVVAAEHGIARSGVSAYPLEHTARLAHLITAGDAPVQRITGAPRVRLVDTARWPVRSPSGPIDREDALSLEETRLLLEHGMAVADELVDSGCDLVLADTIGVGSGTPAAVLISVLTDTEPVRVVGRGTGIDDATWIRKAAAVRDARRRAWRYRGSAEHLLATAGGADTATLTGLIVQAARRRTPVLLGGLPSLAAALVAQLAVPRIARWLAVGQAVSDPGHELALRRLGLVPLQDLAVTMDGGVGPALALATLRAATTLVVATE